MSAPRPAAALAMKASSASQGRAIETMSAMPPASRDSATSGVFDAVRGDDRDADLRPQAAGQVGKGGAGHAGGNGGDARLVPADAGVDEACARGLNGLGQLDDLIPGGAVRDKVDQRKSVDEDRVRPHGGADAGDGFHRKAHAVFVRATPAVGAAVGVGDKELVQEIPLGAHDLDPVIAA